MIKLMSWMTVVFNRLIKKMVKIYIYFFPNIFIYHHILICLEVSWQIVHTTRIKQ